MFNVKINYPDKFEIKEKLRSGQLHNEEYFDSTLKSYALVSNLKKQNLSVLPFLKHNKNVMIFDHQILAAQKVKNQLGGSALLADEVGLGKTIEAGIIIKEYLETGLIDNVLILAPPSLVLQWYDELYSKFNLDFVSQIGDHRYLSCNMHNLLIMSHSSAIQPKNFELLTKPVWDMVIVDEAHSMKNSETQKHQLVKNLKKKYLLLLTATPIQNNLTELYTILELIRPGILGTWTQFKSKYVMGNDNRHLNPNSKNDLQELISQIIIRTTRNEVRKYIIFSKRIPKTYLLESSSVEKEIYSTLTSTIRKLYATKFSVLSLMIYQRLISSSVFATKKAIYKMKMEHLIDVNLYQHLLSLTNQIQLDSKMSHFLNLVKNDKSKYLVFTEFYATQDYIATCLENAGFSITLFNGKMSSDEKIESVKKFRGEIQFMISTGAGGEGQNFQFCHNIVNYDLPWNPMRVEQRIGRVHRIGQKNDVLIHNYALNDTIDAHILELLYAKIRLFTMTLGDIDLLLDEGEIDETPKKWFHEYMLAITEEDAKNRFSALGNDWEKRKNHIENAVNDFNDKVFENFDLSVMNKNE